MGDEVTQWLLRVEWSGFYTWPGDCVVLLEKIHYFHNVSLHPGVWKGTGEFPEKPSEMLGGNYDLEMHQNPIQGGVRTTLWPVENVVWLRDLHVTAFKNLWLLFSFRY